MSLEEVEAFLIKKALARYDGNVSHAASRAGAEPERALPPAATIQPVKRRPGAHLVHERRVQMLALAAGFPGVLTSMIIL